MRLSLLILLIFDPLFGQSLFRKSAVAETGWNVVFGTDPGSGNYDGVKGKPGHTWNFMDVGDTNLSSLRDIRGKHTEVSCRLSKNDGEWGITGHAGIYHAYLYHNSRDRDLEAVFDGLPPGKYFVCVYAHGDAPNQNASIELRKDNKILGIRRNGTLIIQLQRGSLKTQQSQSIRGGEILGSCDRLGTTGF